MVGSGAEAIEVFEWDENKNKQNRLKHDLDFEFAALIFRGPIIEKLDAREDYGEDRYIALGAVGNLVLQVTFTIRGNALRLISAHKAGKNGRKIYGRSFHHG